MIGRRIGPYDVLAKLGAGGMGEVYRARDTKLKRDVAIKVLPADVAADPERLARFQREAEVLAALNHPNIAHIHGLEESGGVTALVMELVEGDDLSQRIARGPIPVDDALVIARQIAEALEAAHDAGIIHRDLKPGNIKVREDGTVKVLDFGLAKALESGSGSREPGAGSALANSPTITSPAMTQHGVILGTAAYMSPEQAKGKTVDKRTDIWAFGCVLFEMVTGRRAFEGDTMADVIAAIMSQDPVRTDRAACLHPRLRELLERCLRKDPKQRCQSIGDARIDIDQLQRDPNGLWPIDARPSRRWAHTLTMVLAATAIAALAGVAAWQRREQPAARGEPIRFNFPLPDIRNFETSVVKVAVSPDGRQIAYVTDDRLYLRAAGQFDSVPIVNSEGATSPFFSPDSQWLGFHASGRLQRVPTTGGTPIAIAQVNEVVGAAWGPDDTIVFGAGVGAGLMRVAVTGGTATAMTVPNPDNGEVNHGLPHFLPSGDLLFTVGAGDGSRIAGLSRRTGRWHEVLRPGGGAQYLSGHLVFSESGNLRIVAIDPDALRTTGPVVPVLDGVVWSNLAGLESAWFSVSGAGDVVYIAGGLQEFETRPVWVDRSGRETPITTAPGLYVGPAISPDGRFIAFSRLIKNGVGQLWLLDVERNTMVPLSSSGADYNPTWIPGSGGMLTYTSNGDLFEMHVGKRESPTSLLAREHYQFPTSWSADGQVLAYMEITPARIETWTLGRGRAPERLFESAANVGNVTFSPSGGWLAYVSDETGRYEVYVRRHPGAERGTQVSVDGGEQPVWSVDRRFLMLQTADNSKAPARSLNVVLHWFDEVRPRLPAASR